MGGCTAVAMARLERWSSVVEATAALDAAMPAVRAKLRADMSVGVAGDCWHAEVVKTAVASDGWHFRKLDLSIVDLRRELRSGNFLVDGHLNDSYVRRRERGDDLIIGSINLPPGYTRVPTDPDDTTTPADNPAGWRHSIAVRDGTILEKEFSTSAEALWLDDHNQPEADKGYFYRVLKVYKVWRCHAGAAGCKGECVGLGARAARASKRVRAD
jgi:hypothetical protein